MSDGADDLPRVPRDAWVSRVAIFAMAALLSFLVALAVLKVHQCSEPGSSPSGKTRVSMSPAPPAPPAASAGPAALPASSAPPASLAAASHTPVATASAAPLAQTPTVRPKATHRPTTGAGSSPVRTVPRATKKTSRPAHADRSPGVRHQERGRPPAPPDVVAGDRRSPLPLVAHKPATRRGPPTPNSREDFTSLARSCKPCYGTRNANQARSDRSRCRQGS